MLKWVHLAISETRTHNVIKYTSHSCIKSSSIKYQV
jgi:hypothetical protein